MDRTRPRPDQLMFAARSRQAPVVVTTGGGRPGKNEQPRTMPGFTPSAIMSPGHAIGPSTQVRLGDAACPPSRRIGAEVGPMT